MCVYVCMTDWLPMYLCHCYCISVKQILYNILYDDVGLHSCALTDITIKMTNWRWRWSITFSISNLHIGLRF